MPQAKKYVRITHGPSKTLLADGPLGWGITAFEGNYYISGKYLKTKGFKANYIPGFCLYKFLYVWQDFVPEEGKKVKNLGWLYWLPNPLLPFIWFRTALSGAHPELEIDRYEK